MAYKVPPLRFAYVAWDVVDERLHAFMLETSQRQLPSSVGRKTK